MLCIVPLCGALRGNNSICSFDFPGVSVHRYDVHVASIEDAKQQMLQYGPKDNLGKSRYAEVDWTIEWGWKDENGSPNYNSSWVKPKVKVTLPRLVISQDAPAEVYKALHELESSLMNHEFNHMRRALLTAELIASKLKSMANEPNPTPQKLNLAAKKLIAQNNSWDFWYDQQTFHGRTEGIF